MKINSKKQIFETIRILMKDLDYNKLERFTAQSLADSLDISRNLVSQYLNEYYLEHQVIKVGNKPVAYLIRNELDLKNEAPDSYKNAEELRQYQNDDDKARAFDGFIGLRGSLNSIVRNCKSAITYPGGLPVLITGPTGAGKSDLVQRMFDYALYKKIVDEKARFITVNCSEYADNPEFFLTHLFGHKKGAYTGADKDNEGLLSLANGGFLFLDEAHSLSKDCQEKLFLFMDKGIYHMVGDNDKWYSAQVHLIFATTENPEMALLKTLYRRIPIVLKMPSLNERPLREKREFICYFLEQEAKKIKKDIFIKKRLFDILSAIDYSENVGQLKNAILACVANAYINETEENLVLDINHLSDGLIEECSRNGLFSLCNSEEVMNFRELQSEREKEMKAYIFNRDLLSLMDENELSHGKLYQRLDKRFIQYLDSLAFSDESRKTPLESLYKGAIEAICLDLNKKYNVSFQNNEIAHLSRLFNDYKNAEIVLKEFCIDNEEKIRRLSQVIFDVDQEAQMIAVDFCMLIKNMFSIENEELFLLDFSIFLKHFMIKTEERATRCIILAHGYSTASSLAAAVNHMVDKNIFDAIDMPMDVSVTTIVEKLEHYINQQPNLKDLIILVDMGSLEAIYQRINISKNINVVIFNNVTIKLALDIGFKIINDTSIKKIKESICLTDYHHNAIFIENRKKKKAILTVCATGIATAEKIANLLKDSLPGKVDFELVEIGYETLRLEGNKAAVFDKYDVKLIVGTLNPKVSGVDFLSVEEIVEQQHFDKMQSIMKGLIDERQLEVFSENLIKNFSLQNLLDYLIILNPKKVVGYVEEIINKIKTNLQLDLSSNVTVGLYIHISCLIERLVTDKYITNYKDLDSFVRTNQHFISVVKDAFKNVEYHYSIDIPVSEIAYIYDYIFSISSVEGEVKSVEDAIF